MKLSRSLSVSLTASLALSTAFAPSPQHSTTSRLSASLVPSLEHRKPLSIALLVEPTPFTHVSGYANRFAELLRFLSKAGDNVSILTVDSKTPTDQLPASAFGFDITHTQGFVFPLYDHISLSCDLPQLKGSTMMMKMRNKLDLIHVTSPGFMIFAGLFYARVMNVPLLMSYHTHLPLYARNYLGFIPGIEELAWAALRLCHSRADLTLVTSPQMKQEMENNGIPRVEVWRKGIDTLKFHPKFKSESMRKKMMGKTNQDTNSHDDDFLMVYVGRLGAEKRLKDIKNVVEQIPKARLCIVGTGPQEQELKEYFSGTQTVFTGQLTGEELSAAFASADCFLMPSDSETLGFVVLESMASGVPVVGCNAGGIPDLIRHEDTGFLVEAGNTEGYRMCVEKLMNEDYRKEMGMRARVEAEKWGWEAATSVLRNIQYEKCIMNFKSKERNVEIGSVRSSTLSVWKKLRIRVTKAFGRWGVPGFKRYAMREADFFI